MENKAYARGPTTLTNYLGIVQACRIKWGSSPSIAAGLEGRSQGSVDGGVAPTAAAVNQGKYPYKSHPAPSHQQNKGNRPRRMISRAVCHGRQGRQEILGEMGLCAASRAR